MMAAVSGLAVSSMMVSSTAIAASSARPQPSRHAGVGGVMTPAVRAPLIGAYYSDWFPANSSQGTLRQHLVPKQGADPTKVNSASPKVAEEAIAQATRSGISFFAMDYWPDRPAQNKNIGAFLRADNIGDMKFCLLYETWDLGFDAPLESTPVTPHTESEFDSQLLQFAQTYFANPNYLRFQGRPVLVLYLTRTLTGNVAGMIEHARALLQAHGDDPYIIGDEIFWRVTAEQLPAVGTAFTTTPQSTRIHLFNAITSYSLYDGDPSDPLAPGHDFVGYPGDTSIVNDEVALYRRYQQAADGIPVIPDVTPGENTRGVRLASNEPAEPRQWLPGAPSGSTLYHFLSDIARPVLSPYLPMLFVTSWNEWNEDTAIQPVGGTPTTRDNSPSGTNYTQGYTYGGEGSTDLNVIRNFVAAAWGRVRLGDRNDRHALVTARSHGRVVSRARTDDEGWYVLPDTAGTTGTLTITVAHQSAVMVATPGTAVQVDFSIS
jgi:hypothetical protein